MGDVITKEVGFWKNAAQTLAGTLRLQMGQLLGLSHDNKRDIYNIYGYPQEIDFETMWRYARRQGVANRITFGMAKSCWRDGLEIFENAEKDAKPVLVDDVLTLKKQGLIKKLERADVLNRIGRFSVLFVGIPDGLDSDQPLGKADKSKLDQVYFKAFAYDGIQISEQVQDPKDPRFGLPEMYQVQKSVRGTTQKDTVLESINVHWTRIVHLNESALDSDVEGMGQLEPIFNRILDLDKTTGGSAEAYFRNAKGKIAFELDPKFSANLLGDEAAKQKLDDAATEFTNQFKDHIFAVGSKVQSVDTPHHTPKDTVMAAYWEISCYTGIPIRLLIGMGSGQMAGSEDQLAYNALVAGRQSVDCSGWAGEALGILANAGMIKLLPEYEIRFPVQQAVTEIQAAEIGETKGKTVEAVYKAAGTPGGDELDPVGTLKNLGIDVEIDKSMPSLEDDDENE